MKILIVIPSLGKGGAERNASMLSTIFSKNGNEVYILVFHGPVAYQYTGQMININVPHSTTLINKPKIFLKRIFAIRKRIKELTPDLIISFLESATIPTIFANIGYNSRHVISIQNNPAHFSFYHKWFLYLYKRAYKIHAVSNEIRCYMKEKYKLKHVDVIYNPVDLDYIKSMLEAKLPEQVKTPYILAVGRLTKQKGLDILINAFNIAFKDIPVNLIIAGEGRERDPLEKLIKSLHLENRVFLIGNVENPFVLYKHALFFVLSSRWEGFANVIVEALACSCPVIASDCKYGPAEILDGGKYGILVPPENIDALVHAMKNLYENNELRSNFSRQGYHRAEAFDIKQIYKKWLT